jgi:hypothetical protein
MSLWEKAMALPLASENDFYGTHRRPHGVDPQHLRVIKDTALRSRLIMAGMAEFGLPTVEELNSLLSRIASVERAVSSELQGQINHDISRLKGAIATLEGDEFERTFRELEAAVRARREVAGQVREETFKRIEADSSFEPRKYLRLISRDPQHTE